MAVITFVNSQKEETGKSLSVVAIATYMAINYNSRNLIISTTNKRDRIKPCFFEETKDKKFLMGLFSDNHATIENESGIEGIAKMARSNKLTPQMITNFTKVVFRDRLEILLGKEKKEEKITDEVEIQKQQLKEKELNEEYLDIVSVAGQYYDNVFVDLDENIDEDIIEKIFNVSDLIIVCTSQNLTSLKLLKEKKEQSELLKSPKTLVLVGRYDKFSKYNSKNISRFLEEKNQVLTVPYSTLYFEASNEASVPDLFLRLKKISDYDDRNTIFISEIKRTAENIIYRLQDLQKMI